jgi:hypothetical protein
MNITVPIFVRHERGHYNLVWFLQRCTSIELLLCSAPALLHHQQTYDGDTMRAPDFHWGTAALIALAASAAVGQGSQKGKGVSAQRSSIDNSCEPKTVNYITHSLPQQCLRTNWSTPATSRPTPRVEDPASTWVPTIATPTDSPIPTAIGGPEATVDVLDRPDPATHTFMSFEEWKEMMLRKSGQDPDDLKGRQPTDRRPDSDYPELNNALDSFGDDGEIALNFEPYAEKLSGIAVPSGAGVTEQHGEDTEILEAVDDDGGTPYVKSKDAGKTCKERFSYSSFDAGATVLKTSPGAKNAKAVLGENKDTYMLLECATDNKYVIVELSDDILVDTIVLANFEFFSSMIRHFRLSVSDRYPVKMDKWKDLGTFEAKNSRDIQPFLVENPMIWAKYVRIEFLTYYGNEFYCPVSLLRVHGTRMLDSWKDSETGRDDDDISDGDQGILSESPQSAGLPEARDEKVSALLSATHREAPLSRDTEDQCVALTDRYLFWEQSNDICPAAPIEFKVSVTADALPSHATVNAAPVKYASRDGLLLDAAAQALVNVESHSAPTETSPSVASSTNYTVLVSAVPLPPARENITVASEKRSVVAEDVSTPPTQLPVSSKIPSASTGTKNKTSSTLVAASASPAIQESFHKTVSKRLQQLEANMSLGMKYSEEQSRFVQESLRELEKRQLARVDVFLDGLNQTVFSELRSVRQQYDQVWQSTVIALESQREQSEREILALGSRLNVLADEVVFQKRMSILQSVLLLSCLALVIFSRGLVSSSAAPAPGEVILLPGSPYKEYLQAKDGTSPEADIDPGPGTRHIPRHFHDTIPEAMTRTQGRSQEFGGGYAGGHGTRRPHVMTNRALSSPSFLVTPDSEAANPKPADGSQVIIRRLSPPLSPCLPGEGQSPQSPLRMHTSMHNGDSRKPLPALPEQPD